MDTRSTLAGKNHQAPPRQAEAGSLGSKQASGHAPNKASSPSSTQEAQTKRRQSHFPSHLRPVQEKKIFTWTAPSRPFKNHNRQYYTTIGTIILLLSLILFFAGQVLPIAVVIAVGFLAYVLSTVPPQDISNQITSFGVRVEEEIYYWEEIGRFWYTEKYKQRILNLEVGRFPFRLSLLLGKADEKEITEILSEILIKEKPPATYFERAASWLQEKIPLDIDS
jgi:hypothetical protein